jgi:glycosyltransferase involved in cell wall biosynthesis
MALRLTEPLPGAAATPAAAAAAAPHQFANPLLARAHAALHARDGAAFQAAFDEAGQIGDRNRRYEARRALLHFAVSFNATAPAALVAAYTAAARAAIGVLEEDPREPVMLNLAGVALYELGALSPAERLFKAAQRLDPALPQVARNIAECKRRKRAGVRPHPQAVILLGDVPARAKRIAEQARPQNGLTLSLCMIVKDEEEMLEQCLASAADHVDEIVIVDTGSTDRTIEIAESFGAKVLHHEWTGDFSEARNVSFDAASGDWLMYLDADEVLVDGDGARLRELTGQVWREAMFLIEINHTGDVEDGMAVTHEALRVFRNRPEYRFEGRIHEQIAYALPSYLPERLAVAQIRMEHYGYLGAVRDAKGKSQRNIELLERQRAEGVDTPFLDFNLGSEYAAAGESTKALGHFERAWSVLHDDPDIALYGFANSCAARLVKALRVEGRFDDAIARGDEILELFDGFTDIVFEQALCAAQRHDNERCKELLERCLAMGDAPASYSPTVGCGSYIAMVSLADAERALGNPERQVALLREALGLNPRFLAAVDPLATALLRRGMPAADVAAEIHRLVDDSASVRFMLAVALYERGAAVEAEAELRAVLDAQPSAEHARLALAEALLSQGRLDEAAQVADAVDPDSTVAAAAAQSAAFARLAGERRDDIAAVLDRARSAGTPAPQLDALAAWAAVQDGERPPATIAVDAAALVLAMLEALLRIERYEPFGALLEVFEVVALPWRERREQLARMYQRRGYLESAAEEWIAVCNEAAPDAAALQGLSAVARARGMDEDAELLAAEAQTLAVAA